MFPAHCSLVLCSPSSRGPVTIPQPTAKQPSHRPVPQLNSGTLLSGLRLWGHREKHVSRGRALAVCRKPWILFEFQVCFSCPGRADGWMTERVLLLSWEVPHTYKWPVSCFILGLTLSSGRLTVHTIGQTPLVGLCGWHSVTLQRFSGDNWIIRTRRRERNRLH